MRASSFLTIELNAQDISSIAKAALAGASGVALPAEELSDETLVQLIHACHALDMEPFVEVDISSDGCSLLLFKTRSEAYRP